MASPQPTDDATRALARQYDAVAYAGQSNADSHPRRLAAVAALQGLAPASVATCRVLEVGCGDGVNLLPMAASLPEAQFVGCDISGHALAHARRGVAELGLANVTLLERDLATMVGDPGAFDFIIAHGVYSWVPQAVRDALMELASRRLSPNGVLFVSLNVYPGCHVREATWDVLRAHVGAIDDPQARLAEARAFAALMAEPANAQSQTDGLLRQEFGRLATEADSPLYHDDLASLNEPMYFRDFAAHLDAHGLVYLAEARLSMMTTAGLAPRMQQMLAGMDRLMREQYLDYFRLRRFRQSLACRADVAPAPFDRNARVEAMHVAASTSLARAAAEGKAFPAAQNPNDPDARASRRLLQWLVGESPRAMRVTEAIEWQRRNAAEDAGARPLPALLLDACYAGLVDLYVDPPLLAATAGERPVAASVVRWQASRKMRLTNLRHEPMRIDDAFALALLPLLDGSRTRSALVDALTPVVPAEERAGLRERIDTYLTHFALHGLMTA